jgi:enoyl-CoA hydratase
MVSIFKSVQALTKSTSLLGNISKTCQYSSSLISQKKYYSSESSTYKHLLTEVKGEKKSIGFIQLNRPKALNALCAELMTELEHAVKKFDQDPSIGCMILTGSNRAFAAGADIKEMQNKNFSDVSMNNFLSNWTALSLSKTPIIAAVNGFALGSTLFRFIIPFFYFVLN